MVKTWRISISEWVNCLWNRQLLCHMERNSMPQLTKQCCLRRSFDQSQQWLLENRCKQHRHCRVTKPKCVTRRLQPKLDLPSLLSWWISGIIVQRMHSDRRSKVWANQWQPVFKVSRPNTKSDQNCRLRSAHTRVFSHHDTVSKPVGIDLCRVNIQKKEDSNMSVLMRIMTNYLQMIAAALAFNLQFPNYLYDAFSSVKQAGNSSGVFLSFDCFLMTTKATEVFNNVSYLKVMWLGLIPIIFLSICISILRVVFISNSDKFRRWAWITVITVLFVLQPSLTQYWLKVFKCVSIGNGISKVEMDIQTDWWSSIHLKWLFWIGKCCITMCSHTDDYRVCNRSASTRIHSAVQKQA